MRLSHHHRLATTQRARRDGGYILVKFAILIVPLLLMTGFSVDIGFWYNRASDIQKAADAAALAGVVWLPNEDKAEEHARAAAARNGFVDGVDGVDIDVSPVEGNSRRLRVQITDSTVGSFFFLHLGGDDIEISRRATAEYVLPVKMGSPENHLGNDPTQSGYPTGAPNLWASISGPATSKNDGDPFSTKAGGNPEYRDWGYVYVIDIPEAVVGRTVDLQIYDAGHYARTNYPNVETADNGTVHTQFELFRADDTPIDPFDGLVSAHSMNGRCSTGPGRFQINSGTSSGTYRNRWVSLCRFQADKPGQWMMQVKSSNLPWRSDAGSGWNQFSVRVTASGAVQPALYTVGDLSLFNNLPGRTGNIDANFYLAQIEELHKGKTLEVSLFDPGDGLSGTYYANIRGPANSQQACRYRERGASSWISSSSCRIQTRASGSNQYNGKWLDIQIQIPTEYTCTDCWWKVLYEFRSVTSGNSPNDRTVWSARVIGDPVHLVEEEAP